MTDKIGIIGSGSMVDAIKTILEKQGIENFTIVSTHENMIAKPTEFIPEPIIPEIRWMDYTDGKTARRNRRKKERKKR
jgi:hypothetical protein